MVGSEVYYNTQAKEETAPYDCNIFNDSGKHLSNSCEYGSCNKIIEAEIGLLKGNEKPFTGEVNFALFKYQFIMK